MSGHRWHHISESCSVLSTGCLALRLLVESTTGPNGTEFDVYLFQRSAVVWLGNFKERRDAVQRCERVADALRTGMVIDEGTAVDDEVDESVKRERTGELFKG